jgi:Kef-type K+ transport system membrane component KefB
MTGIIVATRSYFGGFGPFLSFLFGLIGIFTAYIPIWVLKFGESWQPSLFSVAIIVLSLIYVVVCYFTDFKKDDQGNSAMIQEILNSEDINTSLLEPLYYTFKTKSHRYKSSKFGLLDDISNQVSSISGETVIHYLLWSLVFIVLILEFCVLSPRLMGKSGAFFGEEYQSAVVEQQNSAD